MESYAEQNALQNRKVSGMEMESYPEWKAIQMECFPEWKRNTNQNGKLSKNRKLSKMESYPECRAI